MDGKFTLGPRESEFTDAPMRPKASKNQLSYRVDRGKENRLKILSLHGKLAPSRLAEATVSRHPTGASGTTYKRRGARAAESGSLENFFDPFSETPTK